MSNIGKHVSQATFFIEKLILLLFIKDSSFVTFFSLLLFVFGAQHDDMAMIKKAKITKLNFIVFFSFYFDMPCVAAVDVHILQVAVALSYSLACYVMRVAACLAVVRQCHAPVLLVSCHAPLRFLRRIIRCVHLSS